MTVVEASDTVSPTQATNQPPFAIISVDTYAGASPLTVQFDGQQSFYTDGAIVAFLWNFGDGSTSAGYVTTHTYPHQGTYTATLVVTDNLRMNSSAAATTEIKVTEQSTEGCKCMDEFDAKKNS